MAEIETTAAEETTAECRAEGCQRIPVETKGGRIPEFCERHWKRVPRIVRDLLAQEFRVGQGKNRIPPSLEYTVAVRLAITCVIFHKNHGRSPPKSAIIQTQHELARDMVHETRKLLAERAQRRIEQEQAAAPPAEVKEELPAE